MGCKPNTPFVEDIRPSGWLTFPSVDLTSLNTWEPVDAAVLTAQNVVERLQQAFEIVQVVVRETTAIAGNITKNDIRLYFYTDTPPTPPTEGVVYEPSTTNLIGIADVVTADYRRISSLIWEADASYIRTYNTSGVLSTATNIYIVGLVSGTTPDTYVSGAGLDVSLFTRMAQVTI